MASEEYCTTCSTTLLLLVENKSTGGSSSDSGAAGNAVAYVTPCCKSKICAVCIRRRPRLLEYTPCLRCGDVRTKHGADAVERGVRDRERTRAAAESQMFVLGDSDGEEEEELVADHDDDNGSGNIDGDGDNLDPKDGGNGNSDTPLEVVEVKHKLVRGDTLLSLARRYAADPHHLLTLNNLPHTALSSNPMILHTRRDVVVSRRLVPRSLAAAHGTRTPPSPSTVPVATDDDDDAARDQERRVKRFQLVTKTIDPAVGAAYLSLSELEEGDSGGGGGSGETMGGKKASLPSERDREDRAVEAFFDDDQWERLAGPARATAATTTTSGSARGKWKVIGALPWAKS